jgi:hypothetical protein
MAESKDLKNEDVSKKYKCKRQFGFLKMKVIDGGFRESLFTSVVEKNVDINTEIDFDGSTSYTALKANYIHKLWLFRSDHATLFG